MNCTDFGNLTASESLCTNNTTVPIMRSNTSITTPCMVSLPNGNVTLLVPCDVYQKIVSGSSGPILGPGDIAATLLFLMAFATTLMTDSITIFIIAVTKSLRTKTNAFIVSLCANDIIYAAFMMGVEIVLLIYTFDAFPYDVVILLKTVNFAWGLLMHISNGNLVLVSLERWLYIIHPFVYQRVVTANVVKLSIALTWGSAIAVNILYVVDDDLDQAHKYYETSHAYIYPTVHSACFLMQVAIYTHISLTTYRHLKKISLAAPQVQPSPNGSKSSGVVTSRRSIHSENWKSVKLLIVICGLYFLLVSPYVFVYAYMLLNPASQKHINPISYVFYLLLSFHHCSNFFVYVLGIRQFRKALKDKVRKILSCCRGEHSLGENSHARGSGTFVSTVVSERGIETRSATTNGRAIGNSIQIGCGTGSGIVNESVYPDSITGL